MVASSPHVPAKMAATWPAGVAGDSRGRAAAAAAASSCRPGPGSFIDGWPTSSLATSSAAAPSNSARWTLVARQSSAGDGSASQTALRCSTAGATSVGLSRGAIPGAVGRTRAPSSSPSPEECIADEAMGPCHPLFLVTSHRPPSPLPVLANPWIQSRFCEGARGTVCFPSA
ncbi:unnamed protein product [Lampetra planeri]